MRYTVIEVNGKFQVWDNLEHRTVTFFGKANETDSRAAAQYMADLYNDMHASGQDKESL